MPPHPNPANIASNWQAIRSLAPDRFDAYRRAGDTDELDAVARYVWNMALCAHIYPVLHAVEVTFRNQLHNSLTSIHGHTWFDTASFLRPDERGAISAAKDILTRTGKPHDAGRIVAELSFGFWTQLYGRRHEHDVVRPTIRAVFPRYKGILGLQRSVVDGPLRDIRLLRNRISHHEHILFEARLPALHAQALELVSWMNPQMAEIVAIQDDFRMLYGKTWKGYRSVVEAIFG